jgi:adenylate cyclase
MERKLAAIFAADVVGYSRLMGADEEATLDMLRSYREVVDGLIGDHRGRVFGSAGDSVVAEFASPVEATRCAVAVQRVVEERNAGVPEDRRMRFRIGINLGDIMVEGDNLLGDGVNIAARLEALAEPGGICISGAVFDQVKNRLEHGYDDLGERQVKNIAEPVRVYRVRSEPSAADPRAGTEGTPELALPDKPSIVVLPFENMSADPEQAYFSDGISEDIITDLSKVSGLFVIARNSAFTYKGRAVKVGDVSRELGVRHVLEGSVRKAGNRVRITAQLIDGTTGGHVWAERYDRDLTDIFAVQDEVTREIVSALAVKLTQHEKQRLGHKGTENLEAYDCFLRGRENYLGSTREGNVLARRMFEQAVELDPAFAAAHAFYVLTYVGDYINQWSETPERSLELAHEFARQALALDDSEPAAHFALGVVLLWMRQHEQAIAEAARTIALDPNFAPGYVLLSNVLHYAGRSEETLELLSKAMRLDPHYPDVYLHFLGQANFMLGRYDEAIAALKRRLERNPETDVSRVMLAAAYGHLGRTQEARADWAKALEVNPDYSLDHKRKILPYKDPADFDRIVDGLRKAGLPE